MNKENSNKTGKISPIKEEKKLLWPLGLTAVGIVAVILPFIINFGKNDWSTDPNEWASFSSYLGGLASPIIALAVLVYVYNTFEVQRKELNETRNALEKSYKEQKKQTQIQIISNKMAVKQQAINFAENQILQYESHIKVFEENILEYDNDLPKLQQDLAFAKQRSNDEMASRYEELIISTQDLKKRAISLKDRANNIIEKLKSDIKENYEFIDLFENDLDEI